MISDPRQDGIAQFLFGRQRGQSDSETVLRREIVQVALQL